MAVAVVVVLPLRPLLLRTTPRVLRHLLDEARACDLRADRGGRVVQVHEALQLLERVRGLERPVGLQSGIRVRLRIRGRKRGRIHMHSTRTARARARAQAGLHRPCACRKGDWAITKLTLTPRSWCSPKAG